tara:strand:- start:63 stop:248 length:186 start_codon:yes stop_codon:yes gene_type:complete
MEIYISTGEWIASIKNKMENAIEGSCFHLPSFMHLHAFEIIKNQAFSNKNFKVVIHNNSSL